MATGGEPYHDIRFALMAVVPDRRTELNKKLDMLRLNRSITIDALTQLVNQVPILSTSYWSFVAMWIGIVGSNIGHEK